MSLCIPRHENCETRERVEKLFWGGTLSDRDPSPGVTRGITIALTLVLVKGSKCQDTQAKWTSSLTCTIMSAQHPASAELKSGQSRRQLLAYFYTFTLFALSSSQP